MHYVVSPIRRDIIAYRRLQVSRMRVRGMSPQEITERLAKPVAEGGLGIVDPKSNQPFTEATIKNDLTKLVQEWRQEAAQNTADHKGRVFMELQEVKRVAWAGNDLENVLNAIRQERALLGLDEATIVGIVNPASESLDNKLNQLATRMASLNAKKEEQ